jgi:ankyrin repeat protein
VMLIKMGQNVNVRDAHGQAPLHLASLRGNLDAVEYLVLEAKVMFHGLFYSVNNRFNCYLHTH